MRAIRCRVSARHHSPLLVTVAIVSSLTLPLVYRQACHVRILMWCTAHHVLSTLRSMGGRR